MRMDTSWSRTFSTVCRRFRMAALRLLRKKSVSLSSRRLLDGTRAHRFFAEVCCHVRRVAPQPLQPVKPPAILGEYMKDEIAEVQQNPATGRRSLDKQRLDLQIFAQLLDDTIGDGLGLPFRACRSDDEVVGNRREIADS